MFAIALGAASAAGEVFMLVNIYRSWIWHHRGAGERKARGEYARIQDEQPDIAEARLSEAEFVHYYVDARPGVAPYIAGALLLLLVTLFAAYAIDVFG